MVTEPRSMSLGDVMSATIGVAVGFFFVTSDHTNYSTWPRAIHVQERLLTTIGVISLAIASASIGRQVRYQRRPLPSEWLSILISIAFASYMVLNRMELRVSELWLNFTSDRSTRQNYIRLIGSVSILGFIMICLRKCRHRLRPWATTLGLCTWLVVMLEGFIPLAEEQGYIWLGHPDEMHIRAAGWGYYVALKSLARTPFIMFVHYPVVGVILSPRRRSDWNWIEWASVGSWTARVFIIEGCSLIIPTTPIGSLYWSVNQATELLAIAASFFIAWLIHSRFGPVSRYFYDDPQPEHSTPSLTSPASTA